MKQNVILKSIIRKPIIAILLTLLIGLISYGFVGKAVETILVYRETNRLEGYYRSIGYVIKDPDSEEHPFADAAEIILQSSEVNYGDLQKNAVGVLQDSHNTDFDTGKMDFGETLYAPASIWVVEGVENLDYWFYGTLLYYEKTYLEEKGNEFFAGYMLIFEVDQVLAGYPENIQAGKNYMIWIPARYTLEIEQMTPHLDKMVEGQRYLIRAWHHVSYNFSVTGAPIETENWVETFNLKALDGDDLWYIPVDQHESLDFTLPEYEKLALELDRLNQNLRAIHIIGTGDMSAMPDMQLDAKDKVIVEGRWLNRDDEVNARNVIVISKNLAETRGISLGDRLTMTIRSLKDPYFVYIRSQEDIEDWKTYPSETIDYEVVGIYTNELMDITYNNENFFSTSYVPNSTFSDALVLPDSSSIIKDVDDGFSFVLHDPRTQEAFQRDFTPRLKEAGFLLAFTDNNGRKFVAMADPLRRSNLLGTLLFTTALFIAVALSIFLYLRQQRGNFAILRALGVSVKQSTKDLLSPFLGLGFLGSTLGALLSWNNAHARAGESLSELPLPSGILPNLTLNPVYGIGFWLFVLLILILGVYLGNRKLSQTAVLSLLQGDNNRAKMKTILQEEGESVLADYANSLNADSLLEPLARTKNPKLAINNYSRLTLQRLWLRTLLTIAVAAALSLALGWFQTLIRANEKEVERLYQSTVIQIDTLIGIGENNDLAFSNRLNREAVDWLMDTGYIDSAYLSSNINLRSLWDENLQISVKQYNGKIVAMNDLEIGLTRRLKISDPEGGIRFLDGFGPESISEVWTEEEAVNQALPLLITNFTSEELGLDLGDIVRYELSDLRGWVNFRIIGIAGDFGWSFGRILPDGTEVDAEPSITNLSALEHLYTKLPNYMEASFFVKPEKNHQLKELKTDISSQNPNFFQMLRFWDEELLAVVEPMEQNLSLMERLYPITMVISAVIGGVLCLLLVLNQAKETALLRMLGVEKGKIRAMQVKQILFLTLIGLLLGFILLISLRGIGAAQPSVAVAALVYLVGALLGALLGAIQVSNKKPMELLQVKE